MFRKNRTLLILFFLLMIFSSCSIVGNFIFPQIGTWLMEEEEEAYGMTFVFRYYMTLDMNQYKLVIQMGDGDEFMDMYAFLGTYEVEDGSMYVTIRYTKDAEYNESTGEYVLPDDWTELPSESITIDTSTYMIDGDTLTLSYSVDSETVTETYIKVTE